MLLLFTIPIKHLIEYLNLSKKNDDNMLFQNRNLNLEKISRMTSEFEKMPCMTDTYYCLNNNDCNDICDTSHVQYMCNQENYTCTPLIIDENGEGNLKKCNKKHGFMNAISTSPITGIEYVCLNILPSYFKDDGTIHEYVCRGGNLEIDTNVRLPHYSHCKCPEGTVRVVNSELADGVPRCIKKEYLKLLPSFSIV